jgi:hypothetical protein
LDAFGHVVVAWIWFEQLVTIGDKHDDFYDGKRAAASFFFAYELPLAMTMLKSIETIGPLLLELDQAWL